MNISTPPQFPFFTSFSSKSKWVLIAALLTFQATADDTNKTPTKTTNPVSSSNGEVDGAEILEDEPTDPATAPATKVDGKKIAGTEEAKPATKSNAETVTEPQQKAEVQQKEEQNTEAAIKSEAAVQQARTAISQANPGDSQWMNNVSQTAAQAVQANQKFIETAQKNNVDKEKMKMLQTARAAAFLSASQPHIDRAFAKPTQEAGNQLRKTSLQNLQTLPAVAPMQIPAAPTDSYQPPTAIGSSRSSQVLNLGRAGEASELTPRVEESIQAPTDAAGNHPSPRTSLTYDEQAAVPESRPSPAAALAKPRLETENNLAALEAAALPAVSAAENNSVGKLAELSPTAANQAAKPARKVRATEGVLEGSPGLDDAETAPAEAAAETDNAAASSLLLPSEESGELLKAAQAKTQTSPTTEEENAEALSGWLSQFQQNEIGKGFGHLVAWLSQAKWAKQKGAQTSRQLASVEQEVPPPSATQLILLGCLLLGVVLTGAAVAKEAWRFFLRRK